MDELLDIKVEAECLEDPLETPSEVCPADVKNNHWHQLILPTFCTSSGHCNKNINTVVKEEFQFEEKFISDSPEYWKRHFFVKVRGVSEPPFRNPADDESKDKFKIKDDIEVSEDSSVNSQQSFVVRCYRKEDLRERHLRHTGERPFSCSTCSETFTSSADLKRHVLQHKGDSVLSCSTCYETFFDERTLHFHILSHAKERPFVCTTCNKIFKSHSNFRRHMFLHTGQRPFSCSTCNRSFTHPKYLERHLLTHTGKYPTFTCEVCGKTFTAKSTLKRHHQKLHAVDVSAMQNVPMNPL